MGLVMNATRIVPGVGVFMFRLRSPGLQTSESARRPTTTGAFVGCGHSARLSLTWSEEPDTQRVPTEARRESEMRWNEGYE